MVNERLNVESSPAPGRGAWPTPQYESNTSAGDFERIKGRDGANFVEQKRRAISETPTMAIVSVTTSATALPASNLTGRHTVWLCVPSDATSSILLCNSDGTSVGFELTAGDKFPFFVETDAILLYAKVASGTQNVYVMELK